MAALVLGTAGAVVGGYFGGPVGAMVGGMIGTAVGTYIDQTVLFPPESLKSIGPRLSDLLVQNASYGQPIPRVWGQVAFAGNIIWQRPLYEVRQTESTGGKGNSGPSSKSVTYSYYGRFAVGVCEGPIVSFGRIWADGKLIRDAGGVGKYGGYMTFYYGTEDQEPDPTMQGFEGVDATPAYRGLAYVVFNDLPLADWGNRIPNLKIEVTTTVTSDLSFDAAFISKNTALKDEGEYLIWRNYGVTADSHGNYILNDHNNHDQVIAFAQDGSIVWRMTSSEAASMVDSIAGYAVVDRAPPNDVHLLGIAAAPICNGEFILITFQSYLAARGHFCQWVLIAEPVASGLPNPLGCVRYDKIYNGAPFGNSKSTMAIQSAGNQTADDTILITAYSNMTDLPLTVVLLPTANMIANGLYTSGFFLATPPYYWLPFEIPYMRYYPLGGSTAFANKLYQSGQWQGNPNIETGFILPQSDLSDPAHPQWKAWWHCYINRGYTEWCMNTGISAVLRNGEIADVIGPGHPNGCMVRVDIGNCDWNWETARVDVKLTGPNDHGTAISTQPYEIADEFWLAAGGSALPFLDEYHYLSTGASGGKDTYQTHPALIERQPDGSYLIALAMLGVADAADNATDRMWSATRVFIYNPLTVIATQIERIAGPVYDIADLDSPAGDYYDDSSSLVVHAGTTLYLWGHIGGAGMSLADGITYFTQIGHLYSAADIGLDEIVGDICQICDLSPGDYDVAPLATQRVRGYIVGRETTARATIEMLQQAFFFDGIESDGKIKWKFRDGMPIAAITENDLAARSGGDAVPEVQESRLQDLELPQSVVVRYMDPDRDFQTGAQRAKRISSTMGSRDQISFDLSVVMDMTEAVQIAEKSLFLAWVMRSQLSFTLPIAYLKYDPADVLTLVWGGGTFSAPVYLTEFAFGADNVIEIKAKSIDAIVYEDSPSTGAPDNISPTPPSVAIEDASAVLMDLPPLRDADDDLGFYYAMAGSTDAWHGGALYRSLDGITYLQAATAEMPTPIGLAMTVLPSGPTTVHDDVNTVDVRLSYGELETVTRAQSINGANAAVIGSEILTFDTATPLGGADWRLSGLLRGRKGTEWTIGAHSAGEKFALLKFTTIGRAIDAAAWRNAMLHYKAVSAGLTVGSAYDYLFIDTGVSLKPYSPVHIEASPDIDGNIVITWVRRARIYHEWVDGVDVPLDEPTEVYEVDVLDGGGTVLHTIAGLGTPAATYFYTDQVNDGFLPGETIHGNVYQISSRVGRGFPGIWSAIAGTGVLPLVLDDGGPWDVAGVVLDDGGPADVAGVILDGGTP